MAGTSCSFCTLRNTRSRTGTAGRMWGGRRVWKDGFAGREALAPWASPGALGWGFCFSPQQQLWAGGRRRNQDSREQPKSNPPAHSHGRIRVQTGFASGWVGAPQLQEKQKQNLRRFSSKFFFAPHMVHSKS